MKLAVSWSGGKDCCLALHKSKAVGAFPTVLFSVMDPAHNVSRSNGVSRQLLIEQAERLALPIHFINASWEDYEEKLTQGLYDLKIKYSIEGCVFGDIDIASHKYFDEEVCKDVGIEAILPLWGMQRDMVRLEIITLGIKSKVSVINKNFGISNWLNSTYDTLIDFNELCVDVCGENGEFHTVVFDAPLFASPIKLIARRIYDLKNTLLCLYRFE